MNHYYTNDESLAHHYETIPFSFADTTLQFRTDNGVFSKNAIDYGSRVLLQAFYQTHEEITGTLLDVGCGYGAMGITLAKIYHIPVDMVDVNLRAMDLARHNALKNGVQKETHIFESYAYRNVEKNDYHYIITNPPIRAGKKVVHTILEEAYSHLAPQGELWVVIQKKQGAPSAQKKMEEVFGNVEIITKDKGYYILRSTKM